MASHQFTRVFRIFERMFPGSQLGFPNKVNEELSMVAEIMRPAFIHDVRFRFDRQTVATGGAAATIDFLEPSAGFIHLPVAWHVEYDGAANARVQCVLLATASAVDPWGVWSTTDQPFASVRAATGEEVQCPHFPYPRGNRLRLRMPAPAAATTLAGNLFFLEVPGELCDLQTWRQPFGNFAHTRALP